MYLVGNLGTQMMEYAFARRLIEKRNRKEELRINFDQTLSIKTDVKYAINYFNILPYEEYNGKVKVSFWVRCLRFLMDKLHCKKKLSIDGKLGFYQYERGSDYDVISKKENVVVSGTFANSVYLDDIRDILLEEFRPKYPISERVKKWCKELSEKEAVCISVRIWKHQKHITEYRIQLSAEFFQKEIDEIMRKIENKSDIMLYVTSNDIQWCKDNLNIDNFSNVIWDDEEVKVYEKIEMMKCCKYFALSNSSFSWMGAWLSEREDKFIVLPYVLNSGVWDERVPKGVKKENWVLLDGITGRRLNTEI